MLTETAPACLWLSDGQIYLLEDDRFKNLSKGSRGWRQGDSS